MRYVLLTQMSRYRWPAWLEVPCQHRFNLSPSGDSICVTCGESGYQAWLRRINDESVNVARQTGKRR